MLDFLLAIVYGVIEGITEWLPISSTGHLIILEEVLPMKVSPEFMEMFNVVIQLGAILAVIVLYFRRLNPFDSGKDEAQRRHTWSLWLKVVVGVLPSAVLGLLLDDWMDEHLYNHVVVALMLIVYGVAFVWVEQKRVGRAPRIKTVGALDIKTALLIGAFQCLALIPGTSRSGATILGAIFLGVSRGAAAEYSFFLAIPTMLGASALKVVKFFLEGTQAGAKEWGLLLTGCVTAFLVSVVVIRGLMEYVRKNNFSIFGLYRIALGALVLVYWLVTLVF